MAYFWLCRNCAGDFSISVHFLNARYDSELTIKDIIMREK